jgi:hypothetical protein
MDKKISELTQLTTRTELDVIAIVNGGSTKKISVEDFIREPVIDGGSISGSFSIDLTQGHWFKFELVGDVSVELQNEKEGEEFLFWVYSNGNYAVTSMTLASGGSIYSKGGTLPNPANNAWNLYRAFVVNGGMVLTEIDNFSAI